MTDRTKTKEDFRYLCHYRFEALVGTSDSERFCEKCSKIVYNWDRISPETREALKARAQGGAERVCVAVTVNSDNVPLCGKRERKAGRQRSDSSDELLGDVSPEFFEDK